MCRLRHRPTKKNLHTPKNYNRGGGDSFNHSRLRGDTPQHAFPYSPRQARNQPTNRAHSCTHTHTAVHTRIRRDTTCHRRNLLLRRLTPRRRFLFFSPPSFFTRRRGFSSPRSRPRRARPPRGHPPCTAQSSWRAPRRTPRRRCTSWTTSRLKANKLKKKKTKPGVGTVVGTNCHSRIERINGFVQYLHAHWYVQSDSRHV